MKRVKTFQMLILLLFSGTLSVQAQALQLQDCIDLALKNNLQVQSAQAALDQAREKPNEVRAMLLPQAGITADYQYFFDVPQQLIPAQLFGGPEGQFASGALGVPVNISASLTVNQVLYNRQALMGLKIAKAAEGASVIQLAKTEEDIIFNVSATFFNLQTLLEQQSLLQSRIASTDTLIEKIEILARNGLVKGIDQDRLQVTRLNLQTRALELETNIDKLYNLLKLLCGTDQEAELQIDPAFEVGEVAALSNTPNGFSQRSEYQLLQKQQEILRLQRRQIQAGYYPSLAAFGSLGYNGYNSEFEGFRAYEGTYFRSSLVGLSLNIPVFDGLKKRSQTRSNDLDLVKNCLQMDLFQQQATMEARNALRSFDAALANFQLQEKNKALALEIVRRERLNYREGIISLTDLLTAENDLKEAETNYLSAYIGLQTATLDYKKSIGNLK